MDVVIEISERDKASVMNLMHQIGLTPNSKRKLNGQVFLHYVELTREQVVKNKWIITIKP
jgi:hypothetical protein